MKIFISWSGEESRAVAQVLRVQLPCIINVVKPFVSSEDIEKGAAWFQQVGSELEKSEFGILCLTSNNQNSKWVLFEAGALAGRFSKTRMAPLLINTTPAAIKPPLSQFQLTDLNKREDFFKLLNSINVCLGENALPLETLKSSFEIWWNPFTQKIKSALASIPKKEAKEVERSEREILSEVLSLTRSIASNIPNKPVPSPLKPADAPLRSLESLFAGLESPKPMPGDIPLPGTKSKRRYRY
jgi:hypothetical protein